MQNAIVLYSIYIYIYILLDTVSGRCLSADVGVHADFAGKHKNVFTASASRSVVRSLFVQFTNKQIFPVQAYHQKKKMNINDCIRTEYSLPGNEYPLTWLTY